ncbi:MAG: 2-C-methyl-D-erythritol 4-phosphate cytidylyltransferase, partial [Syntrophomonadaceae bacterium]
GSRMGGKIKKQFLLLNSKPVLYYSLNIFEAMNLIDEVVLVAHPQELDYCQKEIVEKYRFRKVKAVVAGGATRQQSVWNGLQAVNENTHIVAIHDGARPLVTEALFLALLKEAREWGAAIPGVPVRDTVKMVDGDDFVVRTLDRSVIMGIQTPQAFNYGELVKAYQLARDEQFEASDDASLFERYIGRVKVVPGDYSNLKITTREDLVIAEGLMRFKGGK